MHVQYDLEDTFEIDSGFRVAQFHNHIFIYFYLDREIDTLYIRHITTPSFFNTILCNTKQLYIILLHLITFVDRTLSLIMHQHFLSMLKAHSTSFLPASCVTTNHFFQWLNAEVFSHKLLNLGISHPQEVPMLLFFSISLLKTKKLLVFFQTVPRWIMVVKDV